MRGFQELGDCVDGVPVEFLNARCRKSHGNDSWGNVGEVKIKPILLESILGTSNNLAQKVHG